MGNGIKKNPVTHWGEKEDMNISICDINDSIHVEIRLHFSSLTYLEVRALMSTNILCTETSFEHSYI